MTRSEKLHRRLQELAAPETELRSEGFMRIAGLDEAGRGPLAGPVVAAGVIMPADPLIAGVDDSKRIPEGRREELARHIRETALAFSISVVDVETIEQINILESARLAFQNCLDSLTPAPDLVITDAMEIRSPVPLRALTRADAAFYSVAAASILAKTARDAIMRDLDARYPGYGFARHKGYGTAAHREAIRCLGPCPAHRRSFLRKLLADGSGQAGSPQ